MEFDRSNPDMFKISRRITQKYCETHYSVHDTKNNKVCKVRTASILSKVLHKSSQRDILLKIGRLCPQFTLFSELASQDSFMEISSSFSPTLI